jgi:hypothetical protein
MPHNYQLTQRPLTRRVWRTLCLVLVYWPAVAQTAGEGQILPPGRILEVALEKGVDSSKSKPGDPISAVLLHPLAEQGAIVAPVGSRLSGSVVAAHRLGLGLVRGCAVLALHFDRITINGVGHAIDLRVAAVDTGRERVDQAGRIVGVSPVISASGALSSYVLRAAILTNPPSRAAMLARVFVTPVPDHEVRLPAGTTLLLRTASAVELPVIATAGGVPMDEDVLRIVRATVRAIGSVQVRSRGGEPTDQINLAFVGSGNDVEAAFSAAGWNGTRHRTAGAIFSCARAMMGRCGLTDAPMAPMVFDRSKPDYELQKGFNTFSKRHHLRIWQIGTAGGRQLWAAAATEDVKVSFSFQRLRWHHGIHPDTSAERTKVVSDLSFTGCTQSMALIPVPLNEGFRQGDGRMAVIEIGSCTSPRRLPIPDVVHPPGNRVTRYLKRVGSDLWRENPLVVGLASLHMPLRSFQLRRGAAPEVRGDWARQQAWIAGPEHQASSLIAYTELGPSYSAASQAFAADSIAPQSDEPREGPPPDMPEQPEMPEKREMSEKKVEKWTPRPTSGICP